MYRIGRPRRSGSTFALETQGSGHVGPPDLKDRVPIAAGDHFSRLLLMLDIATPTSPRLKPPGAVPRKVPLGLFGRIAAMRRNPIEIWAEVHYEQKVLVGR